MTTPVDPDMPADGAEIPEPETASLNGFRDPGPVPATGRANFRGLPNLVGRDNDGAILAAVVLLLAAVGIPLTVVFARPAQALQAFGIASPVAMVVEAVTPDPDQSNKQRRENPLWDIALRWDDNGVVRVGEAGARGDTPPFTPGDVVSGVPFAGRAQVTLESATESRVLVLLVVVIGAGCALAGVWLVRRTRRGRRLLRIVGRTYPQRVLVEASSFSFLPTMALLLTTREQQAWALDVSADGGPTSRLVLAVEDDRPEEGDTLDVWRNSGRGSQMIAVRRASDGTWWVGRGRAPAT